MPISDEIRRLAGLQIAYANRFGGEPPEPFGVTTTRLTELLERALATGQAVEDWHADLPPDSVA